MKKSLDGAPTAAERWRKDLASWAIPEEILQAAPESPWHFPVELFVSRAEASTAPATFSARTAMVALPEGGTVLDIGCGAGGAALPLSQGAGRLTGVDSSEEMLEAFRQQAERVGIDAETVLGRWPDAADDTPPGDVVVCHHVFYNAPDLPAFAARLTDHARTRVVVELTAEHPQSRLNPLWLRFHGIERPTAPTAMDAVAVLRESGLDVRWQQWTAPRPGGFRRREDLVAWVRRSLCLTPDRDPEVEAAIRGWIVERDRLYGFPDRPVLTLWWEGSAREREQREGPARGRT
jgi:SAM-dependent methyltransferase